MKNALNLFSDTGFVSTNMILISVGIASSRGNLVGNSRYCEYADSSAERKDK
jgi:hypothetical protein